MASGIKAGKAFVELGLGDKLSKGMLAAEKRLRKFGSSVTAVGKTLAKLGGAAVIGFGAAAKVFAGFEEQLAFISTMLDRPADHMEKFRSGLRDMSIEFGESTDTLSRGLYDILSAMIPAEKAMGVLNVAVRSARAGMTDTAVAGDALTTILNSYGVAAEHAENVSNILFTTVRRGKVTFAELAPSIGLVAATAANAGVPIEELAALIATLTRAGIRTERAVTAVNRTILGFLKPTDDAAAAAQKYGISLSTATLQTEGLYGVFQKMKNLSPEVIAKIFPNIRAMRGVIPALRKLEGFRKDIEAMKDSGGEMQVAYKKMANTLAFTFRRIKQVAVISLGRIGQALRDPLQEVGELILGYSRYIGELIKRNEALVVGIAKLALAVAGVGVALIVTGAAIKGMALIFGLLGRVVHLAVVAFTAFGKVLAMIATPAGMAIVAIAAIGATILHVTGAAATALKWLADKFNDLSTIATEAWSGIVAALSSGDLAAAAKIGMLGLYAAWLETTRELSLAWHDFWTGAKTVMSHAWQFMRTTHTNAVWEMTTLIIEATALWQKAFARTKAFFANAWTGMKQIAKEAFWEITALVTGMSDRVKEHMIKATRLEAAADYAKADKAKLVALKQVEAMRVGMHAANNADHKEEMDNIAAEGEAHRDEIAKEGDARKKAVDARLADAKRELRESVDAAKKKRKELDITGPALPTSNIDAIVGKIKAAVGELGGELDDASNKMTIRGTFNARAMQSLMASTEGQRTAKATEATAKNTKDLLAAVATGGPSFA